MVIVVFDVCGNWRICSLKPAIAADQQDEQADDGRQHRPADEEIGEGVHRARHHGFGVSAGGGSAAVVVDRHGHLACSLIWPAVTTCSPALTPSRDRDPLAARRAERTKRRSTIEAARGRRRRRRPRLAARACRRRLHDEDIVAVEAVDDRGARHGQHVGGLAGRRRSDWRTCRAAACGRDWRTSARTVTLRDSALTRASIALTLPSNSRPGMASTVMLTAWPTASVAAPPRARESRRRSDRAAAASPGSRRPRHIGRDRRCAGRAARRRARGSPFAR